MSDLSPAWRVRMAALIGMCLLSGAAVWLLVPHRAVRGGGSDGGEAVVVLVLLWLLCSERTRELSPAAKRALAIVVAALALAGGAVYFLAR